MRVHIHGLKQTRGSPNRLERLPVTLRQWKRTRHQPAHLITKPGSPVRCPGSQHMRRLPPAGGIPRLLPADDCVFYVYALGRASGIELEEQTWINKLVGNRRDARVRPIWPVARCVHDSSHPTISLHHSCSPFTHLIKRSRAPKVDDLDG